MFIYIYTYYYIYYIYLLGHVSPEALINIPRAQHQQEARISAAPWQQLGKEVGEQHPEAGLNVLQCQILGIAPPVDLPIRVRVRVRVRVMVRFSAWLPPWTLRSMG